MNECNFRFLRKCHDTYPEFTKRGKMIDIGARNMNGSVAWFLEPPVQYVGVDIRNLRKIEPYEDIYHFAQIKGKSFCIPDPYVTWVGNFHDYHGDPDNSIDLVTCFNMFEHDEHWKLTVNRAIELLRPGGRFVFDVAVYSPPHGEDYMERHYQHLDFTDFKTHLESLPVVIELIERGDDCEYVVGTKKQVPITKKTK